jgi:hypothetical protein
MAIKVVERWVRDGRLDTVKLGRRAVIGGGLLAVAGCRSGSNAPAPRRTTTSPDAAALAQARDAEARLLASYDAAIKRLPLHRRAPLEVERAIHATHLAALKGTALPPRRGHTGHDLSAALRSSAARLRRLALAAADGSNAALLASIAASHTASAQ